MILELEFYVRFDSILLLFVVDLVEAEMTTISAVATRSAPASSPATWETSEDQPCGPIQDAVRIDDITDVIAPLAKPWKLWKESDVMRAVPILRNRNCFIYGGCSAVAAALWSE